VIVACRAACSVARRHKNIRRKDQRLRAASATKKNIRISGAETASRQLALAGPLAADAAGGMQHQKAHVNAIQQMREDIERKSKAFAAHSAEQSIEFDSKMQAIRSSMGGNRFWHSLGRFI
jgi:hypothetical protein